ncbi:MAG: hypothetical protein ACI915_003718 [Gammaproteobacteria bacterium]|jgi:hypothetical protein
MNCATTLAWIIAGCLTATLGMAEPQRPPYQLPAMNFEHDAAGSYVNVSDST